MWTLLGGVLAHGAVAAAAVVVLVAVIVVGCLLAMRLAARHDRPLKIGRNGLEFGVATRDHAGERAAGPS